MKTYARAKTRDFGKTGATSSPADSIWRGQAPAIRHLLHGPALQPKLTIGAPDDAYEREADRVADRVMRMSDDRIPASPAPLGVQRLCTECDEELRAKPAGGGSNPTAAVPPIVHEVLRSSGKPLDAETRGFFEPRFGRNFSDVRVHDDSKAMLSASAVHARAYTVGRNIVFGKADDPRTVHGRNVMAHELAHVLQQRGGTEPRVQRWSYGAGTHATGGGNTFDEVTAAEQGGANGVDAAMRIIDPLVTGSNWRARHCRQWFVDNCTLARTLADLNSRATIWMWRAAPSTIAGLTDGADTSHHANAEWLFKQKDRWALAGNMIHEYWHDCVTTHSPDIGDDASSACGLPVI